MFLIGRDVVTHLASLQFDSDNMTQRLMEELNGNTEVGHFVRELLVFADGLYGLRRSRVAVCRFVDGYGDGCVDICVECKYMVLSNTSRGKSEGSKA